jgi:hypothetical protein
LTEVAFSTILLGLAWFAALNGILSAVSWCLARVILASRHRERGVLLLGLRMLPAAGSLIFVVTLFVPGHWWLEPDGSGEAFGLALFALAAFGLAILGLSIRRGIRIVRAGQSLMRRDPPIVGVSLAGIVRTRILVGPEVAERLTPAELEVAIAHERAHREACDNLKRFAMACAPDLFGVSRMARRLEQGWHAAAEAAADARAVNGDERRALDLASALVNVAKIDVELPVGPAAWSLLHDPPLLETRVRRLVSARTPLYDPPGIAGVVVAAGLGAMTVLIAGAVLAEPIHRLTETLVRVLP